MAHDPCLRPARNNAALIAQSFVAKATHLERCHQPLRKCGAPLDQQRRDGTFTFWYRYIFNKDWRYRYELEAYRVWLDTALNEALQVRVIDDFWKVVSMMQNYGFNISQTELINALSRR